MSAEITKAGVDLGIVTNNGDAMVAFYRDVLGFREEPQTPFPAGGVMHRLWCGESLIKVVVPDNAAPTSAEYGPPAKATGLRYWTITVSNLPEIVGQVEAAGHKIVVPPTEVRPGVTIAMVTDPDGNWVEFIAS